MTYALNSSRDRMKRPALGHNEEVADEIYSKIMNEYYPAFLEFKKNMEAKRSAEKGNQL